MITRGVYSCVYDDSAGKQATEVRVKCGLRYATEKLNVKPGEVVIAVHADAMGLGFANLTRILRVPEKYDEQIIKLTQCMPFLDFE